jgi:hypothetical protein
MVGKYVQIRDSYISLNEALMHGGIKTRTRVNIHYFESTGHRADGPAALQQMDAILVPGGFGERGIEGKIQAIRYARENGIPYLGICLGMQLAIIEYGAPCAAAEGREQHRIQPRHEPSGDRADHRVAGPGARPAGSATRNPTGGTMRLGAQEVRLTAAGSLARTLYGKEMIASSATGTAIEFNNNYLAELSAPACASPASPPTAWSSSSSCRAPVVRRQPVPPGIHLDAARRPSAVHRIRAGGARLSRRAAAGPRPAHEAAVRFEVGPDRAAAVPDRRPLRHRERGAGQEVAGHAARDHRRARRAVHLQGLLRQGQPLLGQSFRGPAWRRA